MGRETDAHGNYHDTNGRFVSLREYVERIFDERDRSAEFARLTLEKTVNATATAMKEAMLEAKVAADSRNVVLEDRIKTLESGGAPFASRLDDSITQLKSDVDYLKTRAVRMTEVEAQRERQDEQIEANGKQIRFAFITAGLALVVGVIVGIVVLLLN